MPLGREVLDVPLDHRPERVRHPLVVLLFLLVGQRLPGLIGVHEVVMRRLAGALLDRLVDLEFVEDVGPESQAAITSAATPTMPANTLPLRFIDLSPLLPYARL